MRLKVGIIGSGHAATRHKAAYASLPDLFSLSDVAEADVVDICTPNSLHFQQAALALSRGRYVILEKPICGSLQEADQLIEFERSAGVHAFPVFQYRCHPELIGAKVSKDFDIDIRWPRSTEYYATWRGEWEMALGGCLTVQGIHAFDLVVVRAGPVKAVETPTMEMPWPEKQATVVFHCNGNQTVTLNVDTRPSSERPHFRVGNHSLTNVPSLLVQLFSQIHRSIVDGDPPPTTLVQARQSLELLTVAYYSAYIDKPVPVPITFNHPFYQGWTLPLAQRQRRSESSPKRHG